MFLFGKTRWLVSTISYFIETNNKDKLLTCVDSEVLDLFTRRVAAAPTTVTATAIEAAVSASAKETVDNLLLCNCNFTSIQGIK